MKNQAESEKDSEPDGRENCVMWKRRTLWTGLALLVSLMVLLLTIPVWAAGEENTTGSCGDALTWTLDSDTGTLTISGSGEMTDWDYLDHAPWYEQRDTIRTLVITEGVSSVGQRAFYDCMALTAVTLPKNITKVGDSAFSDCGALREITLPDSITALGSGAFSGCSALTSVKLPQGLQVIEDSLFARCSQLPTVEIPTGVTEIGANAFSSCYSLEHMVLPEGVTSVAYGAFSNCGSLNSIFLPESLTDIGMSVFQSCHELTTAGPAGGGYACEFGWKEEIPASAFYNVPLEQIVLPEGIVSLGANALHGTSLTEIHLPSTLRSIGEDAFLLCGNLCSVEIPEGVTSIGEGAFSYCEALASVVLPGSITTMGEGIFYQSELLETAGPMGSGCDIQFGWTDKIPAHAFESCYSLRTVEFPQGLREIGEDAFIWCPLTELVIPEGVTTIGAHAFYNCELTSLVLPGSLGEMERDTFSGTFSTAGPIGGNYDIQMGWTEVIPADAFDDFRGVTQVIVPEGVTAIGDAAFQWCKDLTDLRLPQSLTTIGNSAFRECSSLTELVIPENVTSIGDNAFYKCESLTSVTMPAEVYHEQNGQLVPGCSSFSGCTGVTEVFLTGRGSVPEYTYGAPVYEVATSVRVELADGITAIGDKAFYWCKGLSAVTIPDSVTSIGSEAFYGCTALAEAELPERLTFIGDEAFMNCSALTGTLTLPGTVRTIGDGAFQSCTGLTGELVIPNGVGVIGSQTFGYCTGLESISLPDSVTSIGQSAFSGDTSVKRVALGMGLEQVEQNAFSEVEPLTVTYAGNRTQWEAVQVDQGNKCLDPEKIQYLGAESSAGSTGTVVTMHKAAYTGRTGAVLYVWVDLRAPAGNCQAMADGLVWSSADGEIFPADAGDTWQDALVYDAATGEAFCMVIPRKAGQTQVTVTTPDGASSSCTVTVEASANAVTMDESIYLLREGGTGTVYAGINTQDGLEGVTWTWTTSDSSVAAFDTQGTDTAQGSVSALTGSALYSVNTSVNIYARGEGTALITCILPDGTRASQQISVTGAEDPQKTVESNHYNVPHYEDTPENEGKALLQTYQAQWQEAYQGYVDALKEALAQVQADEVAQRETTVEEQAKALRQADENGNSRFLTFPAGFPDGWKDYAYEALCSVLLEASEKELDLSGIASTDTFTTATGIVKEIARNMTSVQESFSYGGVEIELSMGNYFGASFGRMTCTKDALFGGQRKYTVTICSTLGSTNAVVAEYLNQVKTLGYEAVDSVYQALAEDVLGQPLSKLTEPYLTKTVKKFEGFLKEKGLGVPYEVLVQCYDYYDSWKDIYKKLENIEPEAAQKLLDQFEMTDETATEKVVKKALETLEEARKKLSTATIEYLTTGTVTPEKEGFWDWLWGVNCPVSVAVYDAAGQEQLGLVGDSQESSWYLEGRILVEEAGGAKRIWANEPITFRAVGQDHGTMSCYVEQYDEAGTPLGRVNYYGIALEPGTTVSAVQTGTDVAELADSLTLQVTCGGESATVAAREYIPVSSSARVTIDVSCGAGGRIEGGGAYVRGDGVVLYALPEEGYVFSGWYDAQGDPVASESVYEFTAREDRELTALFLQETPPTLTNYAPVLCGGYQELCALEVEQQQTNLTVRLKWMGQERHALTAYAAWYDDDGQMTDLTCLTAVETSAGVNFTGTVSQEGGTLLMLDEELRPVLEAYGSR